MAHRYLEFAYWTTEFSGEPLVNSIDETITWRETAAPHLITDKQVSEREVEGARRNGPRAVSGGGGEAVKRE